MVSYFSIFGVCVAFVLLWISIGDWVGAFWSLAVLMLAAALLLAVVGFFVSNIPYWFRALKGISWEEHLRQLEKKGKASREHYLAYKVATFEDLTTSCLVHLVDIGEERILCLRGQNYYEFEPIGDDPERNRLRQFPTRSFSLLRRVPNGEVLDIFPGEDVLEPVVYERIADMEKFYGLGIELNDGEVILKVPFEILEATCKTLGAGSQGKCDRFIF